MADPAPLQILEDIPARSFQAIQAAMAVLAQRRLDAWTSRLDVLRAGAHLIVLASPADGGLAGATAGVFVETHRELTSEELAVVASHGDRAERLGHLQGQHYRAVDLGVTTFLQRTQDLSGYRIELMADGPSRVVVFSDLRRLPGMKGSLGLPGYEVEVSPQADRVVRQNFVR